MEVRSFVFSISEFQMPVPGTVFIFLFSLKPDFCKWSLDKMQLWWWATNSVSAGWRLATSDCNCSDLMFHHPMPLVEAGRGLVRASGTVGGLRAAPFGSPVVDARLWRLSDALWWKKSLLVVLATFYKLDQCCEPCINHSDKKTSCFHAFRIVSENRLLNQFQSVHGVS